MNLQSMTGFARVSADHEGAAIAWEVKSVNGKAVEVRLRLPPGCERLEPTLRQTVQKRFSRGNFQATLTLARMAGTQSPPVVNEAFLKDLAGLAQRLQQQFNTTPASADGLLALRGVLEIPETVETEEARAGLDGAVEAAFDAALNGLEQARRGEGEALRVLLSGHLDAIEALTLRAEADPSRETAVIRARIAEQVRLLLDASASLDEARLNQEAAFLATKADIREEIDRLKTHVASGRALLSTGGAIDRKLDFLAQEFNRRSNTLCSKSNAATVTAIGLELKAVVDQFREQVRIWVAMVAKDVGSRIRRRGLMLVLSSPSGAGKSTIARNLIESDQSFELSVSVTTRQRRGSEIDGRHYHFLQSQREFDILRDNDELLEWAEVHGNFYATPRAPAEKAMAEGRDMLFDIDWQGAEQLREKMRGDIVSVFILPPSMAELKARLLRRAEDQEAAIEKRLNNAREEMEHWKDYDFVVVNDDLDRAFAEVRAIVSAERLRRDRRPGLFDFVSGLLDEKVG